MSTEEYERLKRRDRQVMTLADFTHEDIAALEQVRAPTEAAAFNHEMAAPRPAAESHEGFGRRRVAKRDEGGDHLAG
jgi:hypothetical protein